MELQIQVTTMVLIPPLWGVRYRFLLIYSCSGLAVGFHSNRSGTTLKIIKISKNFDRSPMLVLRLNYVKFETTIFIFLSEKTANPEQLDIKKQMYQTPHKGV